MSDLVNNPEVITAIGQWRIETLVVIACTVLIGFVVSLVIRYVERRADRLKNSQLEEAKQSRASQYLQTITALAAASNRNAEATARMEAQVAEMVAGNKTLVATLRGVINPADSRKIIEAELWSAAKECTRGFQVSLRDNHYAGRETDIEDKMKQSCARILDRAQTKLRGFDMAIDPENFFVLDNTEGTRYALVNQLWEAMVRLYKSPANYADTRQAEARERQVYDSIHAIFRDAIISGHRLSDSEYRTPRASSQRHPSSCTLIPPPEDYTPITPQPRI